MNPAFIIQLLQTIVSAAESAEKTVELAQWGIRVLERGETPSDADWQILNDQTAALRKELHEDG